MGAPTLRMPGGLSLAEVLRRWDDHASTFSTPPHAERREGRRRKERRWAANPADDDPELGVLRALGGRRRRRALQDGLLRDLAGTLDAADVAGLFAPVPFGGPPRETVFGQLHGELLAAFLNRQEAPAAPVSAPVCAGTPGAAAWARVSRRGRLALRSLSRLRLLELEAELRAGDGTELVVCGDAYARLVAHALCAWLSLPVSTSLLEGERVVVVRRLLGDEASSPPMLVADWLQAQV